MKRYILILVFICILLTCSCTNQSNESNNPRIQSILIDYDTLPDFVYLDDYNLNDIKLVVTYDNDEYEYINLDESMVLPSDRNFLNKVGKYTIRINYNNYSTSFNIDIRKKSEIKYIVNITNGYISSVNGENIINSDLTRSEFYSGTEIIVTWLENQDNFFNYWTINNVKSSTSSSFKYIVNSDVNIIGFSTPIVYTVSFVTFSTQYPAVNSINTNLLRENDIDKSVYKDGYQLLGWTADDISETQSLSSYSNIVSFPLNITRDITLTAVWANDGLEYRYNSILDEYSITNYTGDLKSLDIPKTYNGKNITIIESNAFSSNQSAKIEYLKIPETITIIEEGAFRNTKNLSKIVVDASSTSFLVYDNTLYSSDYKDLVYFPQNFVQTNLKLVDNCENIFDYAFYNSILGSIKLNKNIERIGLYSLYSDVIKEIDMYDINISLVELCDCFISPNIESIVIPDNHNDSFKNKFNNLSISHLFKNIDNQLYNYQIYQFFKYDTKEEDNIKSSFLYMVINDSEISNDDCVEIIGHNRENISLTIPKTFEYNDSIYKVVSVANYAFNNSIELKEVNIPLGSHLKRIYPKAFSDSLWYKNNVNKYIIANSILYSYWSKNSIYKLPQDINEIAQYAFYENKNIKYIDTTNNTNLISISSYAFFDCSNLKGFISNYDELGNGIYLVDGVSSIGPYAFYGTNIEYLSIQKKSQLEKIGEYALSNCNYLKSVEIGEKTSDISIFAFMNSLSLNEFVLSYVNDNYVVFDGILYEKINLKYNLFIYPPAKLKAIFNPSKIINYEITNTIDKSISDSSIVGTINFNGEIYRVYYDTETINHYYINLNQNRKDLLYDENQNKFYYEDTINVNQINNNSLVYSNIGAILIDNISNISYGAIDIPNLLYLEFLYDPIGTYAGIFGFNKAKKIIFNNSTTNDKIVNFFDGYANYEEISLKENIYDVFIADNDDYCVYSFNKEQFELELIRADRNVESIIIPNVIIHDSLTSYPINIQSYAFVGFYLKEITLSNILKLESLSFTYEINLEKIIMNTSFISQIGSSDNDDTDDVFNPLRFNKSLVIYDDINNIDLYKDSSKWNIIIKEFEYHDETYVYSPYIINEQNPFMLIQITVDENVYTLDKKTDINIKNNFNEYLLYLNNLAVERNILSVGIIISDLMNENNYSLILLNSDEYISTYNEILNCVYLPKEYNIKLNISSTFKIDENSAKFLNLDTDTNDLVYEKIVVYGEDYEINFLNIDNKYICWVNDINSNDFYIYSKGIWNYDVDNLEFYFKRSNLLTIKIDDKYNVDKNEIIVADDISFYITPPNILDNNYEFKYWYIKINENEIPITDILGNSIQVWTWGENKNYDIYAKYELKE